MNGPVSLKTETAMYCTYFHHLSVYRARAPCQRVKLIARTDRHPKYLRISTDDRPHGLCVGGGLFAILPCLAMRFELESLP